MIIWSEGSKFETKTVRLYCYFSYFWLRKDYISTLNEVLLRNRVIIGVIFFNKTKDNRRDMSLLSMDSVSMDNRREQSLLLSMLTEISKASNFSTRITLIIWSSSDIYLSLQKYLYSRYIMCIEICFTFGKINTSKHSYTRTS